MKRSFLPRWLRRPVSVVRPLARLELLPLEDRVTPTITGNLVSGVLTLTFDAANDSTTLSVDASGDVNATGVAGSPFTGVTRIIAQEAGTLGGQSITLSGAKDFVLTSGLKVSGIETVSINANLNSTQVTAPLDIDGASNVGINADIDLLNTITIAAGSIAFGANADVTGFGVTLTTDSLGIPNSSSITSNVTDFILQPLTPTTTLGLGAADASGTLGLNATEAARLLVAGGANLLLRDFASMTVTNNVNFPSAVNIDANGPISVSANLTAAGNIILTSDELATTGQNITVNASGSIQSFSGLVTLNAGDNITINAPVTASTSIQLFADNFMVADAAGAQITILPGVLDAAAGVTIVTGNDADTISIAGQAKAAINIDGLDPTSAPGDTLNIDAQNFTIDQTTSPITVTGSKAISFTNIETLNLNNVGGMVINGTGADDTISIFNSGGTTKYILNGGPATTIVGSTLTVNGLGGGDVLTVDRSQGSLGLAQIKFDGGPGNDLARVIGVAGAGGTAVRYAPDATTKGKGAINIDSLSLLFQNLTPIDIVSVASFTLDPPGADDLLSVTQGKLFGDATKDAIVITGSSGGVGIEDVAVRDAGILTIDTTATSDGVNDAITVGTLDAAPLVVNLSILTAAAPGIGGDTVEFTGSPGVPGNLVVATNTAKISSATIATGGSQNFTAQSIALNSNVVFSSTSNANLSYNGNFTNAFTVDINTTGTTSLLSSTGISSLTTNAGGATTVNGDLAATNSITFNDAVTTTGSRTFSAAAITFNDTLTGGNLTLNATGSTSFNGTVTGAGNLTTDAAGTTTINADITRGGDVTFNDNVTTTGVRTVAGANVSFGGALTGADLSVNSAGATTFNGPVTGAGNLTTDAPGTSAINADVTRGGDVVFNDPVTTTGNRTISGANVTFASTLTGADVTVNSGGVTTFNGTVTVSSLTTDATGSTKVNGGSVATTTLQLFNDPVTVGKNTTFSSSGGGNITFATTLDGNFAVTVNTSGTTTFGGAVTVGSLTTDAAGTTQVKGGTVTTTGDQSYGDAVAITQDTTFTSTAAGSIAFASTLTGNFAVTVNTAGTTSFGGSVNSASLTTDGPGTTQVNGGAVTTVTTQTYGDPVTVGKDTTFTSSGAGSISFASTLGGNFNVTINTAGTTSFGGAVSVASLTTDAPGTTKVDGGSVTTTGLQLFNDPVTVSKDTTFTSSGAGSITFAATLDGNFAATVNTAGTTTFGGIVTVGSLTTDAAGTTKVNGGLVTTSKTQSYGDPVSVGKDTSFVSNGAGALGNIAFAATLGGNFAVTVNTAGTTTFGGAVTVGSLTTDAPGSTAVNGGSVTTTTTQFYGDPVTVGKDTTFASSGAGNITFASTLGGNFKVTVNTAGTTTFGGSVTVGSLTTDAGGTTQVKGGTVTTTNGQSFGDAVTVTQDTTFTSTAGGNIAFASTLTGNFAVTVNTAGTTSFSDTVNVGSLTTDAPGSTQVNGGAVTTTKTQSFGDPTTISKNTIFTSTGAGALGNVAFGSSLGGNFAVTVNTAGVTTFGGPVNVASLTTDAPGSAQVNGGSVTTTAFQLFNDPVTVGQDTTFASSGGGNISFVATLDGNFAVAVNTSGTTTFGGAVTVGSLVTDATGTTKINGGAVTTTNGQNYGDPVTVGKDTVFTSTGSGNINFAATLDGNFAVTVNTAGTTTFGAAVTVGSLTTDGPGTTAVNGGSVVSVTTQTYGDPVTVSQDTTFSSSGAGNIAFASTLSGNFNVTVNTAGTTTFGGAVNVGSLTTDAPGTTAINGGAVTTAAFQLYNDPVTLGANIVFASTGGGAITFSKSLSDSNPVDCNDVVINTAGVTTFSGAVSVGSLTTDAPGSTRVNGGTVTTCSFQFFGDPTTVGVSDVVFTATSKDGEEPNDVTFNQTLDGDAGSPAGTFAVTVNADHFTTFNGIVGGSKSLKFLTTDFQGNDANERTRINGGSVTTLNDQMFNDNVTFSKVTTQTSTAGNITFQRKLTPDTSGLDFNLKAGLDITFNGESGNPANTIGNLTISGMRDLNVTATGSVTAFSIAQTNGTRDVNLTGNVATTVAGMSFDTVNAINLAGVISSAKDAAFRAVGGGISQTAGSVKTVGELALRGGGVFKLDQIGNDAGAALEISNSTNQNVFFTDVNGITVSKNGITTANGSVSLTAQTDFIATAATGAQLINLGAGGDFLVLPGSKGAAAKVILTTSVLSKSVSLSVLGGGNTGGDTFTIAPNQNVQINLFGNAPFDTKTPFDTLSIALLNGAIVNTFAYDGQDGNFTFQGAFKPVFFKSIESLPQLSSSATLAAVEVLEPRDRNYIRMNTPLDQQVPAYTVTGSYNFGGPPTPVNSTGGGLPPQIFGVSPARANSQATFAAPTLNLRDVNNDTIPDLILANSPGTNAVVTIVNGLFFLTPKSLTQLQIDSPGSPGILAQYFPYTPDLTAGINLASAKLPGGQVVIVTAPDASATSGPHVRFWTRNSSVPGGIEPFRVPMLINGQVVQAEPSFFAFESNFRGGVRVTLNDINGDGTPDLVCAAGPGGGPRVRIFDGAKFFANGERFLLNDFFAYDSNFRGGVFVDSGFYDADGKADLLVGPGRGGAPRIRILSGASLTSLSPNLTTTPPIAIADFFAEFNLQSDPLIQPTTKETFRGGVGSVSFANNGSNSLDILITTPRGVRTNAVRYLGNGAVPTLAGPSIFSEAGFSDFSSYPNMSPPSEFTYGATITSVVGAP